MLSAMVLAAGHGTRLAPLTNYRAKPLVPVGDRSALAHILAHLRAAGVEQIAVNAYHRAADVHALARTEEGVAVSEETELLGTAGGIVQMGALVPVGDTIVWAGDVLATPDLSALVATHRASSAEATLAVLPRPRGQGNVGLGARGRVVRLRQERYVGPESEELDGGYFIGVQVLGARLREHLPTRGCLVGDGYIPALRRGELLRAVPYDGPFDDIGTCAHYLAANLDWLARRRAAVDVTADVNVDVGMAMPRAQRAPASSWVGPGARVGPSVVLDGSIVGADAEVSGAGRVTRCVLWPGARVEAPLTDAIVAGDLVLHVPPEADRRSVGA
jgi:mannose-1-phosphate guanylyltransferase